MANATQQNAQQPVKFYRLSHLKRLLGVSGSSIWLWVKKGTFPKPVKLSTNTTAWDAEEIELWIADRVAESRNVE